MADVKNAYTPMQTLIRLVAAGARCDEINDIQVDWAAVLPLAAEQHVLSLVACALLHSPELESPAELRDYLLSVMRSEASVNLIRRQRIMHLMAEMEAAGINVKVLKGYAVAGCYVHPECRGSVDTDMLIDIKQEKQVIAFMEERGFRVDPRSVTSQHAVCQHKKYGMVELHVELYEELIQDVWYQGMHIADLVLEPKVQVYENGTYFMTLGHTDQLIFLTLHMVKHFILGGLTLRMMLDIALYFSCYRDQINAKRYWCLMQQLHFDKLVNGILWNMIRHGGFVQEDFSGILVENEEQMRFILCDLEQGGYMGVKQKDERLESGMEYNRKLMCKKQSTLRYRLYMLGWKIKSSTKYMFPSANTLQKLYPIAKNVPLTFPFLWLWQMVSFPIEKIASGALKRDVRSAQSGMSVAAKERVAMFGKLEML